MMQMEQRQVINSIELRADLGENRTIQGYAVKWGMKSETMGYWRRFKEVFSKGAFASSLASDQH